jgi:hypothetical protein
MGTRWMRTAAAATLVLCAVSLHAQEVLIDIPMNVQIDEGKGDVIAERPELNGSVEVIADGVEEAEGFTRTTIPLNSWWYNPYLRFDRFDPEKTLDFTDVGPNQTLALVFETRFYQDPNTNSNPYGDAPVFVRFYDYADTTFGSYQGFADYGVVYATQDGDPPYPDWTTVVVDLLSGQTGGGGTFDNTSVDTMRFYGTDWAGGGDDFVDFKNLQILKVDLPLADASATVTPVAGTCGALSAVTLDGSLSTPVADITDYTWTLGDGTVLASGASATATVDLAPGIYNLTLTVTGALGLTASDTLAVTVEGFDATTLPLVYPMDAQINHFGDPAFDVITVPDDDGTFGGEFIDGHFNVYPFGEDWWYGPVISLVNDCNGPRDLSDPNLRLQFDARYFQDPLDYDVNPDLDPYDDAPIFVRMYDIDGNAGGLGIVYGPSHDYDPIPDFPEDVPWQTVIAPLTLDPDWTDDGFDQTQVVAFEFYGTDWGGLGASEVAIDAVQVRAVLPPVADAGVDTEVMGTCGDTVSVLVDGSASTPGEAAIDTYTWSLNGTVLADGTSPTAMIDLPIGLHTVVLRVTDTSGIWDEDQVVIDVTGTNPLPVEIALTAADAPAVTAGGASNPNFLTEGDVDFMRHLLDDGDAGQRTWYNIFVDLNAACYSTLDLSVPGTTIEFTTRYYQDQSNRTEQFGSIWNVDYVDAPVFVRFYDENGARASLGILYGAGHDHDGDGVNGATDGVPNDPEPFTDVPPWETITFEVYDAEGLNADTNPDFTDAGFDPTKVDTIEFFGTNWCGGGTDFVDLRDVRLVIPSVETICGDTNCDGVVDFFDIDPFVTALVGGQADWETQFGCDYVIANDINQDGVVDFFDIDPFVSLLVGGGSCGS